VTIEGLKEAVATAGYRIDDRPAPGSAETEDAEAAERHAEITDLTRRVVIGAILSARSH